VATIVRQAVHLPRRPAAAVPTPWGDRLREVVPAELTAGAFGSFLVLAAASARRPAYLHHAADEAFVVLAGTVTFDVPGREPVADLGPGAALYVPRGTRRTFTTGSAGARLLVTQTPGQGLAALGRLLSALVADPGPDPYGRLARTLGGCGIELVPEPDRPRPAGGG
jgi:mannose-6-phosphate isomerase-like protein (cupin superfamily)